MQTRPLENGVVLLAQVGHNLAIPELLASAAEPAAAGWTPLSLVVQRQDRRFRQVVLESALGCWSSQQQPEGCATMQYIIPVVHVDELLRLYGRKDAVGRLWVRIVPR